MAGDAAACCGPCEPSGDCEQNSLFPAQTPRRSVCLCGQTHSGLMLPAMWPCPLPLTWSVSPPVHARGPGTSAAHSPGEQPWLQPEAMDAAPSSLPGPGRRLTGWAHTGQMVAAPLSSPAGGLGNGALGLCSGIYTENSSSLSEIAALGGPPSHFIQVGSDQGGVGSPMPGVRP